MKKAVIVFAALLSMLYTQAQDKSTETENTPKGKWRVNKEYDENGNIIKYDSIYSWSYSNRMGERINVDIDSIMQAFKSRMPTGFSWNNDFHFFPESDSLMYDNFFRRDYFYDNWHHNKFDIEKMLKQIDSSRNKFLQENFPGLLESKPNNTI